LNDNSYTALFWEYDSRIGRRWNIDPKQKVGESPYLCFSGNPIWLSDPLGDEADFAGKKKKKSSSGTTKKKLPAQAKEPANTPKPSIIKDLGKNIPSLNRNGLDFMGGAAMSLQNPGKKKDYTGSIETAGQIAEHGEIFLRVIGKNGLA